MSDRDLRALLARYGQRLHAVAGDVHHVVSPLGAWMVIALCGGLVDTDPVARDKLTEVLGCEPLDTALVAAGMLEVPHPLVPIGAGLWVRSGMDTAKVSAWRASLPDRVDNGDIPSQERLDRWATERTLGLIQHFPVTVTEQVVCLLASVLATKISWDVPFEVADAAEMGPHTWGGSLRRVLRAPLDPRHSQFLTDTDRAGLLAVHIARARGGLVVGSVVAGDPSMAADIVLAEAERIVTAEASTPGSVTRLSLFDLPLGAGPVWDISEEPDSAPGALMGDERFTTIIPAWSAKTNLNLGASPELGFEAAAGAIARALGVGDWLYEARQSAVAKYSRAGFEAAAVTAFAVARSVHVAPRRTPRRAVVRFAHPYAVVAATRNDPFEPSPPAWHGIPVFSAWVAEAENADTADLPSD